MRTNRDLYRFIATLIEKRKEWRVSSKSYPAALRDLVLRPSPPSMASPRGQD